MKPIVIVTALSAAILVLPGAALAEEHTRISLAPIFDYIFDVLAVVLPTVLSAVAIWAARKWFGIKIDDTSRAVLTTALSKGVSLAVNQGRAQAKKIEDVDVQNEFAATVAKYALEQVPDAIVRFNLTPAQLEKMALARIEERLNPVPIIIPSGSSVAPPA